MLADDAVTVFADEWVEAFSAEIHELPESSRLRTDARNCFLHAVLQLQKIHTYPIPFVQVLRVIAERINRQAEALYEATTSRCVGFSSTLWRGMLGRQIMRASSSGGGMRGRVLANACVCV